MKRKLSGGDRNEAKPSKKVPYSWDTMREFDHAIFDKDEENRKEEVKACANDAFQPFFRGEKASKILITTAPKPKKEIFRFVSDLMQLLPNTFFYKREKYTLRNITKWAFKRNFSHVLVISTRLRKPFQLLVLHKTGPSALFKLLSYKESAKMRRAGQRSDHIPQVLLNNFSTPLGNRVSRFLGSLFHHSNDDENLLGRNLVTFHNQRDYIFFRSHRYAFDEDFKKVRLQELGPRFTLKLIWLSEGEFDPHHGDFEFFYKRKEMRSKKKYFL